MNGVALALALGLAGAVAGTSEDRSGAVYLLGNQVDAAALELATPGDGADVLLVAAAPTRPAPLDARVWGGDARTWLLAVHAITPTAAELERVRGARRVLLGPGSAADWQAALWAGSRQSALAGALLEAWRGGAVLVARGAGASALAATCFVPAGEDPHASARNPRADPAGRFARGLGLLPFDLLETQEAAGDLERIVSRMLDRRAELALYLFSRCALRVDGGGERMVGLDVRSSGLPDQPAWPGLLLDARRARQRGRGIDGVELVYVAPQRSWMRRAGTAARAGGLERVEPEESRAAPADAIWSPLTWLGDALPAWSELGRKGWCVTSAAGRVSYHPLEEAPAVAGSPQPARRGWLSLERE